MVWKNDQVTERETEKILELAKKCLEIKGDIVEMGCYKGDTSLLLAEILAGTEKKLWIYDSFEGLPEKTTKDASILGENFKQGELLAVKREVKGRFLRAGLPVPIIKKAWFKDLVEKDLPERIALAFLDGDLYESIKNSLKIVESKMTPGGVIIVHDYNNLALPGVAKATDEWMKDNNCQKEIFQSMAIIIV